MRRLLIPLLAVVLLLLLVSSDQGEAKKVIKKGLKQHQVFEAIPTQIEGPPAADDQDDDDEEGGGDDDDEASVEDAEIDTDPDAFDLDYVVTGQSPLKMRHLFPRGPDAMSLKISRRAIFPARTMHRRDLLGRNQESIKPGSVGLCSSSSLAGYAGTI